MDQEGLGIHQAVLMDETLTGLMIKPEGIYIDGTFGRGGHSGAILSKLNEQGRLIAFDRDPAAIVSAEKFLNYPSFCIIHACFSQLYAEIEQLDLVGQIDGIFLDLGVSSPQLDQAERGFSFQRAGPLDMRMDPTQGISAAEWLAEESENNLIKIFKQYGEERYANRIARAIIARRKTSPIRTTTELAKLVEDSVPSREMKKHPATRIFQAIRIYINQELQELEQVLTQVIPMLKPGGRLGVISFHSLEDRIVKQFIRRHSRIQLPRGLPIREAEITQQLNLLAIGKAIKATTAETYANPRARSAVLRIAEKR